MIIISLIGCWILATSLGLSENYKPKVKNLKKFYIGVLLILSGFISWAINQEKN